MTSYTPPVKDQLFILHEVLKVQDRSDIRGYEDLTPDLTTPILDEVGKMCRDVYYPLNAVGDSEGCKLENGVVRTPTGFKEAFHDARTGGWFGLECAEEYGGQDIPRIVSVCLGEMTCSANMALSMYNGLTHGCYSAILAHGSEEQKQMYLPKLANCEWTGTMNLTEPHCGTDLGLLRTKAEPQGDGSFKISGQKIFISSGEHDMADNIIHLVLAKIPGAPEGSAGISLFVVPKFIVKEDGSLGDRNGVSCGKLEEKMGIHGNSTCVLNYDEATGWLVGEENGGLRAMFTMMNEARLDVGMQGLSQAVVAYQNAAEYANDRLQGRAVTGDENPEGPADPLVVHPDVRRLLMDQKSFVEGGRALIIWAATLIDLEKRGPDEETRKHAKYLISLITPVIKGFLTDVGFDNTVKAQQIFGGHGYIAETGMEQFVRDARIAMIYEGANGVQALDLVGRKLGAKGGKPVMALFDMLKGFAKENKGNKELNKHFLEPLKAAGKDLQAAGMYFMMQGKKNPNNALAGSTDFLHAVGHVLIAFMWAKMAKEAYAAIEAGTGDEDFYKNKIITGRYYMERHLPETSLRLARIQSGGETMMSLSGSDFLVA
jgi:alkylation response protein AidB-like acyl-CoA dehydrogenase